MTRMRLTALITGTVQGVGYRRYVQRYARDLGLHGVGLVQADVPALDEGLPRGSLRAARAGSTSLRLDAQDPARRTADR